MNRTFVSLYFLIVASILAFGWVTDQVWQTYTASPELSRERQDLLKVIALSLDYRDEDAMRIHLEKIETDIGFELELFDWADFAASSAKDTLRRDEVVVISDETSLTYYLKLPINNYILSLKESSSNDVDAWLYRFLLIGFYLFVALAIYFWVLPLTRDLKRLQIKAETMGNDGQMESLRLKPSSAIFSLAHTFNTMAARIRGLLASQREMTHGISHELRTPLARMKFTMATLESELEAREEFQSLSENIVEMERLITQFLNYASFEARSESLQFECGELEPMVERVIQQCALPISVTIQNTLTSAEVSCEWHLIEHCVKNLLQNASRYAEKSVEITLAESKTEFMISVHDDGPGVPEDEAEHIFEAFYRSKKIGEGSSTGFGLGLALVSRIMQWHNGGVCLQKSSLGGACFMLTWAKPLEAGKG